jgi:dTDP-glucose 4,6-dehydratase
LKGGPIQVGGDGTPFRSYLYAADLAVWLWTILFKGKSSRPYNVGSEEAVNIAQLAHIVAKSFKPNLHVAIATPPVPGNPSQRYVPMTNRAKKELGLEPRIELPTAVAKTILWHQEKIKRKSKI